MLISFILFLIIVFLDIRFLYKREIETSNLILNILFVSIISIMILVFPILEYSNIGVRILNTIYFGLKSIWMNQDISVVEKLLSRSFFHTCYYGILQILFIMMPVLTAGFLLTFITSAITSINLLIKTQGKDLHVFSCLNEKSEYIAKKLREKDTPREVIIFTSVNDEISHVKSIKIKSNILDFKVSNKKKSIKFYVVSDNYDNNINDTLKLINKYKSYDDVSIYVLCNDRNASIIFDSIDKGNVILEIINETERSIYNLVYDKPLYENALDKTISLLIVGCGNLGSEFLNIATWCSVMPGYKYKAVVFDLEANKIKEKFLVKEPELLSNYDISFVEGDYQSNNFLEVIKKNKDVNYILVAMDTDQKNLDAAIMLRGLYLKNFDRMPVINLWCSDDVKMEHIKRLKIRNDVDYQINAFGSYKDIYYNNLIVSSYIEKLARQIHFAYTSAEKYKAMTSREREVDYNKLEYSKRSSRASALHIKYKLYSVLGDKFTNDMKKNQELFSSMYNKNIENKLADCEHSRWNAYERSIGYSSVDAREVEKYYSYTKYHENGLTKQHPALVDNKDLDKVSDDLRKIGLDINFRQSDIDIINALVNGHINL